MLLITKYGLTEVTEDWKKQIDVLILEISGTNEILILNSNLL